jgi:hypothetical protein
MSAAVRILGLDPGLNITGYGVVEALSGRIAVCEAGVVRGRTKQSLAQRLAEIHSGVAEVIAALRPDAVAIEQLYSHYKHPRTAILMGHARGVRQRPRAQEPDATGDSPRAGPVRRARAARRGRRAGRGFVSLLFARAARGGAAEAGLTMRAAAPGEPA